MDGTLRVSSKDAELYFHAGGVHRARDSLVKGRDSGTQVSWLGRLSFVPPFRFRFPCPVPFPLSWSRQAEGKLSWPRGVRAGVKAELCRGCRTKGASALGRAGISQAEGALPGKAQGPRGREAGGRRL